MQHSEIDYKICDFCEKFTAHYEGRCMEHWYIDRVSYE